MYGQQNCLGQKMFWTKMGLSHMLGAKFAQRLWLKKTSLFPSLILFVNMLVGRKLLPPCLVFQKVHSTMLKIVNMLKMKCLFFRSEENVLDKVMQGVGHKGLSFNLPQFPTYSKRESQSLKLKTWRVCCNSFKLRIVHKNIGLKILVGPWSK